MAKPLKPGVQVECGYDPDVEESGHSRNLAICSNQVRTVGRDVLLLHVWHVCGPCKCGEATHSPHLPCKALKCGVP